MWVIQNSKCNNCKKWIVCLSVCKGSCLKIAPLFKRKYIPLDLLEAAGCQSASWGGLDERDARGPACNRKSCLGRKLSDLIPTLTLILVLTLPSFAMLRKDLCLAGVGVKEREDKEGVCKQQIWSWVRHIKLEFQRSPVWVKITSVICLKLYEFHISFCSMCTGLTEQGLSSAILVLRSTDTWWHNTNVTSASFGILLSMGCYFL